MKGQEEEHEHLGVVQLEKDEKWKKYDDKDKEHKD